MEADCDPVLTGDPEAVRPLIAEQHRPHLVLLDLMLPDTDGMALMEELPELRERPVIFVSAYGGDQRITRALELGADDYIVKPFSPTELIARIRTVLRRSASAGAGQPEPFGTYRWGDLAIDYGEQLVTLAGRPLELTYLEQRMLFELALRAGEVLSHAELLPRVWGPAHSGRTGAVRTLVKQLRPQAGRRRRAAHLHLQRAPRRLPHAPAGRGGRAGRGRVGGGSPGADRVRALAERQLLPAPAPESYGKSRWRSPDIHPWPPADVR